MAKTVYSPTAKLEEDILESPIIDIKKLINSFKDTGVELAAYSLKARV